MALMTREQILGSPDIEFEDVDLSPRARMGTVRKDLTPPNGTSWSSRLWLSGRRWSPASRSSARY